MTGIPHKILLGITTLSIGVVSYQAVEISSLRDQIAAGARRSSRTEVATPHLLKGDDEFYGDIKQVVEKPAVDPPLSLSFDDARKPVEPAPMPRRSDPVQQPKNLRQAAVSSSAESLPNTKPDQSAFVGSILKLAKRASELDQYILQSKYKDTADWNLLTESDWLKVVAEFPDLSEQQQLELAVQELQKIAQANFLRAVGQGLAGADVVGKLNQISDINQFLAEPISDDVLSRYELVPAAALGDWKKMFASESTPPAFTIRETESVTSTQGATSNFYMGLYLTGGRVSRIVSQVSGALPTKAAN